MGGKHGVENLSKVAIAFFEAGEVGHQVQSEKLKGWRALARVATLTDDVFALISVDYLELKKEAAELDQGDKAALVKAVADHFDLTDDALESKVMATLAHGLDIMQSVQELYKVHAS